MTIQIDFFHDETEVRQVAAGETIFQEGDLGDVMYGVQEGEVEFRVGNNPIRTIGPGDIFGEMALVDREPRSATAIAKTACKLVVVDESSFMFRIQHNPIFALYVMQVMAQRLREESHRPR